MGVDGPHKTAGHLQNTPKARLPLVAAGSQSALYGEGTNSGCALTVGDRSEKENLRPVLSRVGEFSDLFLARSETSLWSPTFSDLFWPTSEPSIATHSTGPGIRRRDTRVHRTTTKNRSFSLFSFPDFVVRIAGYYFFEYRSLRARLQSRDHAPFRNAHAQSHAQYVHFGRHAGPAGPAE